MSLQELRAEGITLAKGIIGENLTKDDLFFCASLARCLHLIDGEIVLLRERNLTCAGPILRLQMDNCMRTYAAFIAEDKIKVIDCLIYGTPIKNERDINGKKMTDGYLKEEMTKIDGRFSDVYEQASGYIHLSEKAFYQTVTDIDDDGKITLQIGPPLGPSVGPFLLEIFEKGFADGDIYPPYWLWCATRQEDSEKSKSSVPPVVYTAGGILMLPDSTVHGTQLVSSAADSAEFALYCSN